MKFLLLLLLAFNCYAHDITAQSWIVTDENGRMIAGDNEDRVMPIASITKLITTITVLKSGVDIDEKIKTESFGTVSRRQLIDMALVRSNNMAADQLCRSYELGYKMCIEDMNYNMQILGMTDSRVFDSTGLNNKNRSTALDLVKLLNEAGKYPEIVSASSQSNIRIKIRKRWVLFKNTNPLIGQRQDIIVSKTGFTRAAGGCLAMLMSTDKGMRSVVVLGSRNTHTRIPEAEFLAENY